MSRSPFSSSVHVRVNQLYAHPVDSAVHESLCCPAESNPNTALDVGLWLVCQEFGTDVKARTQAGLEEVEASGSLSNHLTESWAQLWLQLLQYRHLFVSLCEPTFINGSSYFSVSSWHWDEWGITYEFIYTSTGPGVHTKTLTSNQTEPLSIKYQKNSESLYFINHLNTTNVLPFTGFIHPGFMLE